MIDNLDEYYYIQTTTGEFIVFHQIIVRGKFTLRPKKLTTVCSKVAAERLIDGLQSGKISENIFIEGIPHGLK